MKAAIIGVLALLILGGGGAGAYFYFDQSAQASIGDAAHSDAGEVAPRRDTSHHSFVELSPLILPIIDRHGVSQTITLVVVVEVDSSRKADLVNRLRPRLTDAYIQELYGALSRHAALDGGVLRVADIKQRMLSIIKNVLGEDTVEDILLQVVEQRRI